MSAPPVCWTSVSFLIVFGKHLKIRKWSRERTRQCIGPGPWSPCVLPPHSQFWMRTCKTDNGAGFCVLRGRGGAVGALGGRWHDCTLFNHSRNMAMTPCVLILTGNLGLNCARTVCRFPVWEEMWLSFNVLSKLIFV